MAQRERLQMMRWGLVGLALVLLALVFQSGHTAPAPASKEETLWKQAQVDGKYRMLLRQIKVEKDRAKYGAFHDLGFRNRPTYAGHTDLPRGWWVYVDPYWYIWRDLGIVELPKRGWGPEQATGEPDTNMAGDMTTAWASRTPDDSDEWLLLEYDEPIVPSAVLVYETYNPGALTRVTFFKADGTEVEGWKGKDPTAAGTDKGVSEVPVKIDFKTKRVKLYLDSRAVAGWNEIDAVGLRDKKKKLHWAVAAEASSTFAQPYPEADFKAQINEERIRRLEDEVRRLKKIVEELQKASKPSK